MADGKDSLADLERHRLRLEENVSKLRKSLQHWRQWDAEYEGLKEEILARGKDASKKDLHSVGENFGGDLVTQKEIENILENEEHIDRTPEQIVNLIAHRIDYVHQNVLTTEKQLLVAENKLNALLVLQNPDAVQNEDGLPLTEITETLDEEGNVISSTTTRPGESTEDLVHTLKKAGIKDLPDVNPPNEEEESSPDDPLKHEESMSMQSDQSSRVSEKESHPSRLDASPISYHDTKNNKSSKSSGRISAMRETKVGAKPKSVKFANIQDESSSSKKEEVNNNRRNGTQQNSLQEISRANNLNHSSASKSVTEPKIIDDGSNIDFENAVIPENESKEDAAIRQEMLKYNMEEVGAVVAELTVDESDSDVSFDYDEDYFDEEEEDKFGRSTKRILDDDYMQEMLALERKLLGKNHEADVKATKDNIPSKSAQGPSKDGPDTLRNEKPEQPAKKKSVSFAAELDIAPQTKQNKQVVSAKSPIKESAESPMHLSVVEHSATSQSPVAPPRARKFSRFKAARASEEDSTSSSSSTQRMAHVKNGTHTAPPVQPRHPFDPRKGLPVLESRPQISEISEEPERGPVGRTLADRIIERPSAKSEPAPPNDEDFDGTMLRRDISMEYYAKRNRMIEREGGFSNEKAPAVQPVIEERKMSRFRAARLGKQV